jgi:protein phosphatase
VTVLRAGAVTDVGRARQVNQDTPLVADEHELWAVADGMGGHNGGEVASAMAVQSLRDAYGHAGERSVDALLDAAASANAGVNDAARENPELRGMGTTLVALARTDDDEIAYISVGDSRIYLLRDGELSRLTVDHSLVEEMVREGSITPEEARTHPRRNVVTRAIGIDAFVNVDSATIIPYTGDRFLLCSDGLFNEVEQDKIASILRRLSDPDDAAGELVRLANEAGGRDNITVLVVDVVDDGDRAAKASALVGSAAGADDLAGFAAGADRPDGAEEGEPERRSRREQRAARREALGPRPRRFTWRVLVFLLLLAGLVATGIAAIGYYARGTYFVGFDGDTVTVFQGKPGGTLWFEPTVVEHTEFTRADVRPELVDDLEAGVEIGDRADALGFPITVVTTTTTTTTTTSTTTTSTTTPPVVTPAPAAPTP